MSVMQLRKATAATPPSRVSPEREALWEAIHHRREAEAESAALAIADGWGGTAAMAERSATAALKAATEALEQAKQDAATRLVSASPGAAPAPAMSVRDTRAAVTAAGDDIAAAVAARATIAERVEPAAKAVEGARWRVEACVDAVVRAETNIDALLSEIDALQHQLADKGRLLEWLTTTGRIPRTGSDANPRASEIGWRFWTIPGSWIIAQRNEQSPSTVAFIAQHAALHDDAAAPLPG